MPTPREPRLMLFDLYHGGHHGQYVRALVDGWAERGRPGRLDVVVSREFGAHHPEVLDAARGAPGVAFHPTEGPVGLEVKAGRGSVLRNDLRIGPHLRRAIERHRPDHCVLMYLDHVQLSLATGLRFGFPVRLSGIYFRPSFYYRRSGAAPTSARVVLDDLQKRALLRLALGNPHLDTVFSLDPYAVGPIGRLGAPVHVAYLPEPFEAGRPAAETAEGARRALGVEPDREVLLLFGSLDVRKGLLELLGALEGLPDALARRACVVMAGPLTAHRAEVLESVAALRDRGAAQVVLREGFVSDPAEIHRLFRAASLVLMPYQRHIGSSNVLVRAAAAGVPVLGQDYGLLGTLIRDRRLGLTVDTTRPAEIARGLARFLDGPASYPFDPDSARAYAGGNTERAMALTLFDHLLGAA